MKQLLFLILVFGSSLGFSKECRFSSEKRDLAITLTKSKEELLLTELDDMKNLFPFNEKLNPEDPSLCIETIAKKQQDEFIKSQDLINLKPKDNSPPFDFFSQ